MSERGECEGKRLQGIQRTCWFLKTVDVAFVPLFPASASQIWRLAKIEARGNREKETKSSKKILQ